jgi:hypothetical protein
MACKNICAASVAFLLVACGGGGGGSATPAAGPVASTNAFNLQSGYAALVSAGYSKTFTLSGTCTGTFTLTTGAASTSTTFEGSAAVSGNEAATATLIGCTPSSIASTGTRYFNSSYAPLGFNFPSGNGYGIYATVPVITTNAHVGDVAIIGTINLYTDNTKSTPAGREDVSYVITADTATTAIVNLIFKTYNSSSVLTSTEQDFYRMAANGTLTPMSFDIQYANGSTTHLVGN